MHELDNFDNFDNFGTFRDGGYEMTPTPHCNLDTRLNRVNNKNPDENLFSNMNENRIIKNKMRIFENEISPVLSDQNIKQYTVQNTPEKIHHYMQNTPKKIHLIKRRKSNRIIENRKFVKEDLKKKREDRRFS